MYSMGSTRINWYILICWLRWHTNFFQKQGISCGTHWESIGSPIRKRIDRFSGEMHFFSDRSGFFGFCNFYFRNKHGSQENHIVSWMALSKRNRRFEQFLQELYTNILTLSGGSYGIDRLKIQCSGWTTKEIHQRRIFTPLKIIFFCAIYTPFWFCETQGHPGRCIGLCSIRYTEWPYPKDIEYLRRFLAFSNFYRHFIPRLSHVVTALTDLTGSKSDVQGGLQIKYTREAFSILLKLFSSAPFLLNFDSVNPRVIQVDALASAVSGILSQHDEEVELRLVSSYLKKSSPPEKMWQVHNQELGVIIFCFQEWRAWHMGEKEPVVFYWITLIFVI